MRKIEEYKRKRENFKAIKVSLISLKRVDDEIDLSKRKSYVVPHKYNQQAQEEIKRLINEGIMALL